MKCFNCKQKIKRKEVRIKIYIPHPLDPWTWGVRESYICEKCKIQIEAEGNHLYTKEEAKYEAFCNMGIGLRKVIPFEEWKKMNGSKEEVIKNDK